jgi:REP element-mobilizing transposase RayT
MNRVPKLGEIVRVYKASSARLIRTRADESFAWQRNYFEHVIRNDESLNCIREYIQNNPLRWDVDRENPSAITPEPENAWDTNR